MLRRCRPGRVAAFGRHAAYEGGAEQEEVVGAVAGNVALGTCPASTAGPLGFRRTPPPWHRSPLRGGPWNAGVAGWLPEAWAWPYTGRLC